MDCREHCDNHGVACKIAESPILRAGPLDNAAHDGPLSGYRREPAIKYLADGMRAGRHAVSQHAMLD